MVPRPDDSGTRRSILSSFTGNLRALATAGDGRVFFLRHTGATQGLTTVEYFDANDVIQALMQSDGVTPFQADVEHLVYHAPSNALIGSSSWGGALNARPSATACIASRSRRTACAWPAQ